MPKQETVQLDWKDMSCNNHQGQLPVVMTALPMGRKVCSYPLSSHSNRYPHHTYTTWEKVVLSRAQ